MGAFTYFKSQGTVGTQGSSEIVQGVYVRVGFVLVTIWLAYPQLATLKNKFSVFVLAVVLILLMVVATRPQLFPITAIVAVVCLLINGGLRRLIRASKEDGRPK